MDVLPTGTHEGEVRETTLTRAPKSTPQEVEPGLQRSTVVAIWAITAAFAAVTLLRSAQVGIPLRDPGGKIVLERFEIAVELLLLFVALDAIWACLWGRRSLLALPRVLRERWPWRRVWPVAMAVVVYHLVYICYRNLKSWDAFRLDRDHNLQGVDRAIFDGHTPAVMLHQLFGQDTAALVFNDIYNSFPKLVTVAVVGTLVWVRPVRRSYLFFASMLWIWILGTATYYLVPSLGPFATYPQDFVGLTETAVTRSQNTYLEQRAHLLADPSAHDAFASISAFASLHVGVTCTIMLMAYRYGRRKLAIALGVYLGAVVVSTIYVGMHFVVDDVAGVVIAVLAVRLGQLTVGSSVSPQRSDALEDPPPRTRRPADSRAP
jgi:membrane-associated phospholipid phosphatase